MKKIVFILFTVLFTVSGFASANLVKLHNPTLPDAREFFNWTVSKYPVTGFDGRILEGYNEFRSSKGNTLHVGNATYTPAQPLVAFEKTISAMEKLGLQYAVNGVGSFDNDANIFAQFNIGANADESRYGYKGSDFSVNGKQYRGLITMGKGNDESFPLSYWLTIVCIVCANTWRMARNARKGNAVAVTMKQTKNSEKRVLKIEDEIAALFAIQETVQATLERMAHTPISLNDAERAFLGLLKPDAGNVDLTETGKTRLRNTLDRYKNAFAGSPGVNSGATVEDWFNAVTFVDTHGNTESKKFNADKQFVSSEFGTYADRKQTAFERASNPETWDKLIVTGDEIMQALLARPVIISTAPAPQTTDFARLIAK